MSDSLLNELSKFKDLYYNENKKKTFQPKTQKYEVAKEIASRFDVNILLQKTAYIIPNTNKIYINYLLFKQFGEPGIYELFVKYVQNLATIAINRYNTFECHINIDSFTISAAERYKGLICTFNNYELGYTEYIDAIYVYNSPRMVENIYKIFFSLIDEPIKKKLKLVKKIDSECIITKFNECV